MILEIRVQAMYCHLRTTLSVKLSMLFANANTHINELYDWFCANRISLNANKTKYIVIRPKHSRHDISHYSVHIGNTTLTRIGNDCTEKLTKFLGMHLDENLSWKYHINEIKLKKNIKVIIFSKAS